VPPNRDEAVVEFELEGEFDDKVRVEIFHPDAAEDVTSKIVEGFFDVSRNRRLGKPRGATGSELPTTPVPASVKPVAAAQEWTDLIADDGYRRVLKIIEERRSINEAELQQVLGNSRRVRAFSRHYDDLVKLISFEVEVRTVNGMKAYVRKD
jgi:hypothetical protein